MTKDKAEELLRAKLAQLQQLKKQLDTRDHHVELVISGIEGTLTRLRLGVPFSILMHETDQGWSKQLAFMKIGKTWRLVIAEGLGDENDPEPKPLVSVSRDERADALESFVPQILDVAITAMTSKIRGRDAAIDTGNAFIKTVEDFIGPPAAEPGEPLASSAALGVFGEGHPGMASSSPSEVIKALESPTRQTIFSRPTKPESTSPEKGK